MQGHDDEDDRPRGRLRRHAHTRWSQTGQLTTGDPIGVAKMQADLSELEDTYITIAFGVSPPANGLGFYAIATINASVNGNPITRQVSVANSTEISIPAEALSVFVQDATPAALGNVGAAYSVTITAVPGVRSPVVPVLLHDPVSAAAGPYNIVASGNFLIPIPQGVGVVGALVAAVGAEASQVPDVQVQELTSGPVITYESGLVTPVPVLLNLVPGSTQLKFVNKDTSNAVNVSVLWIVQG